MASRLTNQVQLRPSAPGAVSSPTTGEEGGEPKADTKELASLKEQLEFFVELSKPYFLEDEQAKWLLGAVIALTFLNSGVSVAFSYLSRDFWSALNAKDAEHFQEVPQPNAPAASLALV